MEAIDCDELAARTLELGILLYLPLLSYVTLKKLFDISQFIHLWNGIIPKPLDYQKDQTRYSN